MWVASGVSITRTISSSMSEGNSSNSRAGRRVTDHEDGGTVVVPAPVILEFGRPPSGEDRTRRVPFVLELPGRPGRLAGLPVRVGPLVQPLAILAAEEIVGVGDVPVEGHRHVEHRNRHFYLLWRDSVYLFLDRA